MRAPRTLHRGASAAALAGIVIFLGAAAAHASVVSETLKAVANHPDGGHGLELAITRILTNDAWGKPPHVIAQDILTGTRAANDEQMAAIAKALAAQARALAETNPTESRAIAAAVLNARNPVLRSIFNSARGRREPGLVIPSGNGGGRLDTTSPS